MYVWLCLKGTHGWQTYLRSSYLFIYMRNLVDFRFNTDVNIYKRDLNQSNLIT